MSIDQVCEKLISTIEQVRGDREVSSSIHRVTTLEIAIRSAVLKLEETKKSFKSRKIREVREELLKAVSL